MTPPEMQGHARLAHLIDQNLKRIFLAKFGHVLTPDEWKALPIATRRAMDQQARQQANHIGGNA
ncbi:hypothetical protein ANRL1_02938 [Anaerolineae bacterium]|nr:hypothetical protein ANRL1_02938 [Anaerolineae bacterium]